PDLSQNPSPTFDPSLSLGDEEFLSGSLSRSKSWFGMGPAFRSGPGLVLLRQLVSSEVSQNCKWDQGPVPIQSKVGLESRVPVTVK
uniref:Uncharacterized protein n=1 Tax=Cannabis sativa TaxID=3483 RepID=A0A803QRW2_CANSA